MHSRTASTTDDRRTAFTLIDLILALAILMIAMSVTLPFLGMFRESTLLDVQLGEVEGTLRDARRYAVYGKQDMPWGVRIFSGSHALFAGTGYVSRIPEFDEVHLWPSAFASSGATEVVFGKITGEPTAPGAISIFSDAGRRTISINTEGLIDHHSP